MQKHKNFIVKAMENGAKHQFEGYLTTYGNADLDGDVMEKGAFREAVKNKPTVPMLFNHDRNKVLGKLELSESESGVFVKGVLNLKDEKAANIYELLKMGALTSMSVGFNPKEYEPVDTNRLLGGWKIKKADIFEGSVCCDSGKSKCCNNRREIANWRRRRVF